MIHSRPNQCKLLIDRMLAGERFTQRKAMIELSIGRLPSRIFEIKKTLPVKDRYVDVTNQFGETCRVKEYWIDTEQVQG